MVVYLLNIIMCMNNLAPIILFTYCRPDHTKQTVEALAANEFASESDLFIYSDAPKNAKAEEGVRKNRDYIKTIKGFKTITIIERETNWGLARSLIDGITTVIKKYGKAIIVEDDIITSPYFLKYMNEGLEKYKETKQVGEILGYLINTDVPMPESFFSSIWGCWGWATWKDRWDDFNPDADDLYAQITSNRKLVKKFDIDYHFDLTRMLRDQKNGKIDSWAIRWAASNFLLNKFCLYPGFSLVRQIGMDGADGATHSSKTSLFDTELSQTPIKLNIAPDDIFENNDFWEASKRFYPQSWRMKVRIILFVLHLNKFACKISEKLSWI